MVYCAIFDYSRSNGVDVSIVRAQLLLGSMDQEVRAYSGDPLENCFQDHLRLSKVTGRPIPTTPCYWSIVTTGLSGTVSEKNEHFEWCINAQFSYPMCLMFRILLQNFASHGWAQENYSDRPIIPGMKKFDHTCKCFPLETSCAGGRHNMTPPLQVQVDSIFVFIRQVAPVPACWLFRTSATTLPLTFWPWKWCPIESRVTWATSVPILIFLGLCSWVRPDVPDRQTDVRQKHRLMPQPYGAEA